MSKDRQKLLPYLENLFNEQPLVKEKCLKLAKNAIEINSIKRFFNNFPCLIPSVELNTLATRFENIIRHIKPSSIINLPHTLLLPPKFQKEIQLFEQEIIKHGIEDLVDDEGHVEQAFLDLFQCKVALPARSIVSAYVAAVNEHITQKVFSENDDDVYQNFFSKKPIHLDVKTAVYTFLNQNYGRWVKANLDSASYVVIEKSTQNSELEWGSPRYAPTLFLFVAMMTGIGTALFMKNRKNALEEKTPSVNPKP